jgi:chromosome segregation ATPase
MPDPATDTATDSTAETTDITPESTDTEPAPEVPAAATEIDPDGERKAREDEIYDEGVAAGRAESLEPLRAEHAAELAALQAAHANEITEAKREIDALRRAIDGKQAEIGRAVQALADARKKLEAFGAGFRLDPEGATETNPGDFWGAVARIEAAGSEHDEAIIEARKRYPELHAAMVRSANRQ